jgi:hypothetical protein
MASWLGGGGGGGKAASGGGGSGGSSGSSRFLLPPPPKPKKKERWLVTRKTWRYMADAGKLLIPESLRKGKDYKDYSEDDLQLLEEHYQSVCDQQREFIIWEGPLEDPRVLLAKNRKVPPPPSSLSSSDQQVDSLDPSEEGGGTGSSSDYRFESHSAKFRIVLPTGEKPPPGYIQVGTRSYPVGGGGGGDGRSGSDYPDYRMSRARTACTTTSAVSSVPTTTATSSTTFLRLPSGLLVQELPPEYLQDADWSFSDSCSPLDSGILSPAGDFLLSPRDHSPSSSDDGYTTTTTAKGGREGGGGAGTAQESGIGSGADSIVQFSNKCNVSIQTDPLPQEFFVLQAAEVQEEKGVRHNRKMAEEEEQQMERIAQETAALAKREQQRRASEDVTAPPGGSSQMPSTGDTVMRYLKMVRRNSKSVDQKKADRFRSMNYDPTLRNIKPKYNQAPVTLQSTVSLSLADQLPSPLHQPFSQAQSSTASTSSSAALLQHVGVQCDDSLLRLLRLCQTPVDPGTRGAHPLAKRNGASRKFSLTPSESLSESVWSPRYSLTISDESPPPPDADRDFFGHLYGGETASIGKGAV